MMSNVYKLGLSEVTQRDREVGIQIKACPHLTYTVQIKATDSLSLDIITAL